MLRLKNRPKSLGEKGTTQGLKSFAQPRCKEEGSSACTRFGLVNALVKKGKPSP